MEINGKNNQKIKTVGAKIKTKISNRRPNKITKVLIKAPRVLEIKFEKRTSKNCQMSIPLEV